MPPRCQTKERAGIGGFAELIRIIDKCNKAKRHDGTNTRNGHQAARDRVALRLCLQRAVKVSIRF